MLSRLPLFAKIQLWFFLNLLLLAAVALLVVTFQFHFGMDWLLASQAGDRVQAVADALAEELREEPRSTWEALLKELSEAQGVDFGLFANEGRLLAGAPAELPDAVRMRIGGGPPGGRPIPDGPGAAELPPRRGGRFGPRGSPPKMMVRTTEPTRYWVLVRLRLTDKAGQRPFPATLVASSRSFRGNGLFFDVKPWLIAGGGVLILSGLFWLPLVRSMTRAIGQLTRVTEQIAEGRFEARVPTDRGDEIGSLAQSVNRMAERLSGYVNGQKRFLGDISHELCAPLARLQMVIGILEQRGDPAFRESVQDAAEEVKEMSSLVNELLSFSKAGLRPQDVKLQSVELLELVRRVVDREAPEARVDVRVPVGMSALGDPELVARALANLVRNALRYAGESGPIVVLGEVVGGEVQLKVQDQGPGVPEEFLPRIFDPFFRVEASRSRETGGVGLGLSIVKTCMDACQGRATAHNRVPSGLEVILHLQRCQ
jgi:two-component system sensor histidine kinase CpxA